MDTENKLPQDLVDQFVGAAHGDLATVRALLGDHPQLVTASATWHELAIEAAAQTGRTDIAELLLEAGAPLDICTAAMLGDIHNVTHFLDEDPGAAQAVGAHGIPVLYFPVITGHSEVAELLLQRGASVNAGEGGNTPLHGAVLFRQRAMAEWLLGHGADPDARDYNGRTPADLALESGDPGWIALFQQV